MIQLRHLNYNKNILASQIYTHTHKEKEEEEKHLKKKAEHFRKTNPMNINDWQYHLERTMAKTILEVSSSYYHPAGVMGCCC